ncbi:serine/threonine-protein kinase Nek4-like isoform X1 [Stegodyphus dumicola]|uniref:serine/threonine-protein kinase Nek4-like isoform X1 n=1 Tax=Stegodyphus dumicola TaxID=202533 RepID=UPI0015A8DB95|nr:serine/threonine-protein kinase Nek4-like isoform X1 [Stegodyphus dumicola]
MENYQLIKQIGQGHSSEVWLVKCSKTRKKYVLKRIDLRHACKREQRAAYLEARLLSTLKHPNIVTYLDSFHDSNASLYIVMGYCEHGDLYTCIKNRNGVYYEEKQIIHWFVQICMALKYLHDKNVLHRDLKTQNIFLTRNELIKIGDLGIARVLNSTHEMATTLIGTPYYMSPEIFAGKPYNQKSDVWALGCCMYEIATLKQAFNAQDIHTLIQKIMKGKVSVMPDIYSPEFLTIISSMLTHEPQKRPSITELLLNDYIRKFILLFLQDSSERSSSSHGSETQNKPHVSVQRSKSNCSLPPFINKKVQHVNKKKTTEHESECSLPPFCNKAKQFVHKEKITENELKIEAVITIPDINGNGDGNDNSQHRAVKDLKCLSIVQKNKCSEYKAPDDLKDNQSKENISETITAVVNHNKKCKEDASSIATGSQSSTPRSIKYTTRGQSPSADKIKGEKSYQFLNNLTYTIASTRFKPWENFSNTYMLSRGTALKTKQFTNVYPPKSADELLSYGKNTNSKSHNKRSVASARGNHEHTPPSHESTVCTLPQIKNSETRNQATKCISNEINLPILQNKRILYFEDNGARSFEVQLSKDSFDRKIDKTLLCSIMECNSGPEKMVQTGSGDDKNKILNLEHQTMKVQCSEIHKKENLIVPEA